MQPLGCPGLTLPCPRLPLSAAYGYKLDPEVERTYTTVRKTHNQGAPPPCCLLEPGCACRLASCIAASLPLPPLATPVGAADGCHGPHAT
jgi:hypothetical protein